MWSDRVIWLADWRNRMLSKKSHLQEIAVKIFGICVKHDIRIEPTWIPRELNQQADYYSKLVDTDDWSIDNETYSHIITSYNSRTAVIDRRPTTSANDSIQSSIVQARKAWMFSLKIGRACNWTGLHRPSNSSSPRLGMYICARQEQYPSFHNGLRATSDLYCTMELHSSTSSKGSRS